MTVAADTHPRARTGGVGLRDMMFVIRQTGERTAEAAAAVLRDQLGPDAHGAVQIVEDRPFSRAVASTLRIAATCGRPWTIGMDADVLLVSQGVERLRQMCEEAAPKTFTVTGLMLCKFYGGFVFRGVHCYRASLTAHAMNLVGTRTPDGPDPELKPESAVVHAMAARGHPYEGRPLVLAAHDFEQSYRHIYLKMRLRGRREAEATTGADLPGLIRFCAERAAAGDQDFVVAGWGIDDGAADARRGAAGAYDWAAAWPEFETRMTAARLREKPPLSAAAAHGLADRLVASHDLTTDTRTPAWIRHELGKRGVP